MSKELKLILFDGVSEREFYHTYLVYQRIKRDRTNSIYINKASQNINQFIKEIFESNWSNSKILKEFDYGEGGPLKYRIIEMKYDSFKLFFLVDAFSVIFINYINEKVSMIHIDDILIPPHLDSKIIEECIYNFSFDNKSYRAITTGNVFINFSSLINYRANKLDIDTNQLLMKDFISFINNKPQIGRYEYTQFGPYIVIYNFDTKIKSFDEWTTKLF